MSEKEWVKTIIQSIQRSIDLNESIFKVSDGIKLPYSNEILTYEDDKPCDQNLIKYETDILISELLGDNKWKPRIVIEAKINHITTHDVITYSQKAQTHKNVHPYLRYGILMGNMADTPLSGRLFRHGQHFDFMQSWKSYKPDEFEWDTLISIIKMEIEASRTLNEIIFNSRLRNRKTYSFLHRPIKLG